MAAENIVFDGVFSGMGRVAVSALIAFQKQSGRPHLAPKSRETGSRH